MTTPSTQSRRGGREQQLEALAFYLGAHGIDPAPVRNEIEARFAQETIREKEEPLRKLHALEARLQRIRRERPEAEAMWTRTRKDLGETPPPYFHAVTLAVFACFALLLDTIFLAPTMDILNIPIQALQYVAAAGFAALFTAWFELSGLHYRDARTLAHRFSALAGGAMGVLCLIFWGLLRGHQLRFAARIAENPLGDFLAAHPILASAFFIFVTVATPMVGALALLYAWRGFSQARTWRRARTRFDRLRNAEVEVSRQVQTAAEQIEHLHQRKEAECREWKEIFNHYYERGRNHGASRETLWSVLRKSLLGVLCAIPLALLIPKGWFPAQLAIPAIPGLGLFVYFNRRRLHPTPERYLKQENTQFAVIPDAPQVHEIARPEPRLLSKGDHDENPR